MRLSSLIAPSEGMTLHGTDCDITGLASDSRKIQPGFLFVAIPGTVQDGRIFIQDALRRGAAAVMLPDSQAATDILVPHVTVGDIRHALSYAAAKFYPREPGMIAAITGTSGKTSSAQFVRELWRQIGRASASIGTLGFVTSAGTRYGALTTPDAITLHQLLDQCVSEGITHVAIEASSHGIVLDRLSHAHIKVAGFTNLSRDHLDYHGTMENYLAAKLRLFSDLTALGGTAVFNADIAEYEALRQSAVKRRLKILSYGTKGHDIKLLKAQPISQGQILKIELFGKGHEVVLPLIGSFQAWNALCALGMVIGSGEDEEKTLHALTKLSGVPGRLQWAGISKSGGTVFVDYAHKPDALENILHALRLHVAAHADAKLGIVFGCGGNRDKGKRPIMGEIAERLADWVIVTDDNPRHEDASTIRKEILAGCKSRKHVREIGDRGSAIAEAIRQLRANDILVIAGKGHESGQIIGDDVTPFDDLEMAKKALGA